MPYRGPRRERTRNSAAPAVTANGYNARPLAMKTDMRIAAATTLLGLVFSLPVAAEPADGNATAGAAQLYQIDAQASDIRILVYRGGVLKHVGHNHVVSLADIEGAVVRQPSFGDSRASLVIPVHTLVVDNPQVRAEEGADFSSEPSEQDIAGTRGNMLGAKLLAATRFPQLGAEVIGIRGSPDDAVITARITIRDAVHELEFPAAVQYDADKVRIKGEFRVLQSAFGIRPFSVMFGSLRVQDEITVKFNIAAHAAKQPATTP